MDNIITSIGFILIGSMVGNITNVLSFVATLLLILVCNINLIDSDSDSINCNEILEYIKKNASIVTKYSIINGEKEPTGICFSWSKKFIAYISTNYNTQQGDVRKHTSILIISSNNIDLKKKVKLIDLCQDNNNSLIKAYMSGSHFHDNYYIIDIPFNSKPYTAQIKAMDIIKKFYEKNDRFICRTLICGNPNIGKSMIGKLLAKEYNTSLCFDFNLLLPGARLLELYRQVQPTKENPLIIQIDEFDILINNIHESKNIHTISYCPNKIHDKASYNTFMAEYLPCYPYVIYVLTSNQTFDYFDDLDKSYTSPNRIDIKLNMISRDELEIINTNTIIYT